MQFSCSLKFRNWKISEILKKIPIDIIFKFHSSMWFTKYRHQQLNNNQRFFFRYFLGKRLLINYKISKTNTGMITVIFISFLSIRYYIILTSYRIFCLFCPFIFPLGLVPTVLWMNEINRRNSNNYESHTQIFTVTSIFIHSSTHIRKVDCLFSMRLNNWIIHNPTTDTNIIDVFLVSNSNIHS